MSETYWFRDSVKNHNFPIKIENRNRESQEHFGICPLTAANLTHRAGAVSQKQVQVMADQPHGSAEPSWPPPLPPHHHHQEEALSLVSDRPP